MTKIISQLSAVFSIGLNTKSWNVDVFQNIFSWFYIIFLTAQDNMELLEMYRFTNPAVFYSWCKGIVELFLKVILAEVHLVTSRFDKLQSLAVKC